MSMTVAQPEIHMIHFKRTEHVITTRLPTTHTLKCTPRLPWHLHYLRL